MNKIVIIALVNACSRNRGGKIMAIGKHVSLATELEKEILAGTYGWEGGLPSTSELAQKWNISINTVKNALSLLEGKNLIKKRGIGYYINRIPTIMTQYVAPAHLRLNREGYSKNIGPIKKIALPEHIAQKINFSNTALVTHRVQISGEITEGIEKPLQVSHRYYLFPVSEEKVQQMQNESTYDPMWDDTEIATEMISHDEITARLATEEERVLLELPGSTSIANVFETINNKSGNALMVQEVVLSPRTTLIFDFPFTNQPQS